MSAAAAVAGQRATLAYDLYAASLPVARLEVTLETSGRDYRVASTLQTIGLAATRVGWLAAQQTRGILVDGVAQPQYHSNDGEWRAAPRSVRLIYDATRSVEAEAQPTAAPEGRSPVTVEGRAGTVDLMSALAQLAFSASPEAACAGTPRIFDGRRRYDLRLTIDGIVTLARRPISVAAGPALRCLVSVRRIAGFPEDGDSFEVPERLLLWLMRDAHSGLVLPVRLQAASPYGLVVVHLSSTATGDLRQARAE